MTKKKIGIGFAFLAVLLLGYLAQTVPGPADISIVQMKNTQGTDIGIIKLSETKAGVLLTLDLYNLKTESEQAIHIHEIALCDGSDGFKGAGGHYNPEAKAHGLQHPEGHHAGDMPNLHANEKGILQTTLLNQSITLQKKNIDKRFSVYDEDGSAIVIHEGADDHISQPAGEAGGRFACGVIE